MTTDELIRHLSAEATPVRHRPAWSVLWPGLVIGALAAIGLSTLFSGMMAPENAGWLAARVSVGIVVSVVGMMTLLPLMRPGSEGAHTRHYLTGTAIFLLMVAGAQIVKTPADHWSEASVIDALVRYPLCVLALALPVFGSLLVALRTEAPTRLRLTGTTLGMTSGGIAAAVYAVACGDCVTPTSLLCAVLGIALATATGALAGPYLLRW